MIFRVALAGALCVATAARAGDKPLYQPAPAWVLPAPPIDATKLTDADPVLLVLDQQQRLEGGQLWGYSDLAMRIASPQVLTQMGTLPLPWDPSLGDIVIHKVEIIRGAERIDVLASGARFNVLHREEGLERAMLNGMLTATLSVEGLRVGDVLRLNFSTTRKDPALNGHVATVAPVVPEPMRLQFGRIRVLWPKASKVQWRTYMKGFTVAPVDTGNGYTELTVKLPVAKPVEMPGDAPQRFQPLPIIDVSDYADWADLSKDMAPLYATEGLIAPGSPLAAEVARIAAASADPRTRTAMALRLVQDKVRYLFKGMDGGNYVPQAPAQTWTVRYGDCKAKSLLLLAMLRALGVEAEATLVSADAGDLLAIRLASPGAFNHVIVRATVGGETLWLDGTGGGARLTDLGDVPPFRHALPLRIAGSALVDMPLRPGSRPVTEAEYDLDASAGVLFPAPYKARIVLRGAGAEQIRVASAQSGKEAAETMIDGILQNHLGANEAVDRSFSYDEENATAVVLASGLAYPDWSRDEQRYKTQLDSSVDGIRFAPDRARPAWRDVPVASGDPADARVVTRMRLPGGGAGFVLEGDQTLPLSLGGVLLRRSASLTGGVITVDDRVIKGIGEVAPADIPAARAQVNQAKARLLKAVAPADTPPLFRIVEAAKRSKALDPILKIYARQIAEAPEEAGSYTDRAWFLDRIYDRAGAIRDLDKAIALDPDADNHLWRARLYAALGDDKRALADAQAALAIDPGSTSAIGQVAQLTADLGKRDDAIAMLAERVAEGGDNKVGYATAQADLMADGGQVDEAIALLDGMIAKSPGNPSLLNSRCWMKGTHNVALDTALKDCTKAIELSESPAAVLDSRAMVYFRMQRPDDAIADLDAALEVSPDQAASLYLRGVIRRQKGDKTAEGELAAARMIAPRIDEVYARYGIKP